MPKLIELSDLRPLAGQRVGELHQVSNGWTLLLRIEGVLYAVKPKHPPARIRVFKTPAAAIRAARYCGMKELVVQT